jgi:hypothetical protein
MTDDPYYAAPPPPPGQPYQTQRAGAGLAIAALVLGILALLLSWTILGGVVLGLLAIILGWVASRRARRGLASGRGSTTAAEPRPRPSGPRPGGSLPAGTLRAVQRSHDLAVDMA